MFEKENLKELVLENLTWVPEGMKKPKNMNRRLHDWTKGYVQERLEYFAEWSKDYTAYTSKVCHYCASFKERNSPVCTTEVWMATRMLPTTLKTEEEKKSDRPWFPYLRWGHPL